MKILLTSLVFLISFAPDMVAQSNLPVSADKPLMSFEKAHINIGEINKGDIKEMEFPFTNTGNESIKISLVSSCECTTIKYPRMPIAPGESGSLKVTFDSTEKEESETVDIDVYLENIDPITEEPIWFILDYSFILIK